MAIGWRGSISLCGLLVACTPKAGDAGDESDGAGDDGGGDTAAADDAADDPFATGGSPGSDGGTPDGGDGAGDAGDDGTGGDGSVDEDDGDGDAGFVLPPDGGAANECDPTLQDCPRGEKCTAWANDGGTFWNANRCIEVTGTGVDGDPCMIEGSGVSGIDDCDLGFICLNTNADGIGTCVEFCAGEDEDCAPGNVCAIYNDGVLPICLVACDPLLQDCPESQSCIDTPNQTFICFTDASGEAGAAGDPCPPEHGENSCDPGMWCGAGSFGCEDVNCCTPFCDLTAMDCTAPDECVSFFGDAGAAPPGFEDVGVCVVP